MPSDGLRPAPSRSELMPSVPPPAASDGRRVAVGMLMIFSSGLLFAVMSALTRVASASGLSALQIVFLSGIVRWVGLALTVVREGVSPLATRAVRPVLLCRSFCGWAAFSSATFAFGRMPLGDATAIYMTSPVWAAIFARLLLGEELCAADCLAILLCFGGVLLVIRPCPLSGCAPASLPAATTSPLPAHTTPATAADSDSTLLPSLVVLAGAVFAASVAVAVRLIQLLGGAHPAVIAHAYALFSATVSLPACFLIPGQATTWRDMPAEAWAACLGVGLLSIPNQMLVNTGLQRTPAGLGAMMHLVDVPAAFTLQVLVFGQPPDALAIAGSLLIVATCAASACRKWRAGVEQSRRTAAAALRPEFAQSDGVDLEFERSRASDRELGRSKGPGQEVDRSRESDVQWGTRTASEGWDEFPLSCWTGGPAVWCSVAFRQWWVVRRAWRHASLLRPAEPQGPGVEMPPHAAPAPPSHSDAVHHPKEAEHAGASQQSDWGADLWGREWRGGDAPAAAGGGGGPDHHARVGGRGHRHLSVGAVGSGTKHVAA